MSLISAWWRAALWTGGQSRVVNHKPPLIPSQGVDCSKGVGEEAVSAETPENVSITLTSGQFLCRFTPSCLSTGSSLCLERISFIHLANSYLVVS